MIDPATLTQGMVIGVAATQAGKQVDKLLDDGSPSNEQTMIALLTEIRDALAPQEKDNYDDIVVLQPYPYEYTLDENWHKKPHVCIFFAVATPLRFAIEGVGTFTGSVGPGWVQIDLRGQLSTTDTNVYNVIVSYRQDALGLALA